MIPVICKKYDILIAISFFSFSYNSDQPKLLYVFICSIVLLLITVLLVLGCLPLNIIVCFVSGDCSFIF